MSRRISEEYVGTGTCRRMLTSRSVRKTNASGYKGEVSRKRAGEVKGRRGSKSHWMKNERREANWQREKIKYKVFQIQIEKRREMTHMNISVTALLSKLL